MKLLITGVSHKTAPVEVRECLAFREETLPAALADLKAREGVAEAVILSTCNRVEITVTTDDRVDPQAIVDAFLADHKAVSPDAIGAAPLPARRPATPSIICSASPPASIPWWSASRRSSDSSRPPTPPPRIAARCAAGWTACDAAPSAWPSACARRPASARWRSRSATPPWNWRARSSAR